MTASATHNIRCDRSAVLEAYNTEPLNLSKHPSSPSALLSRWSVPQRCTINAHDMHAYVDSLRVGQMEEYRHCHCHSHRLPRYRIESFLLAEEGPHDCPPTNDSQQSKRKLAKRKDELSLTVRRSSNNQFAVTARHCFCPHDCPPTNVSQQQHDHAYWREKYIDCCWPKDPHDYPPTND